MEYSTLAIVIITSCIISVIYIFLFLKFISKGKDGKDGKDGTCPTNCKDGKDGINGKDGSCPQNCINGRDGTDGPAGSQGPTGPQGPQGPQGPKGDIGNQICIGTTCIDENDLKKLKSNTFPSLIVTQNPSQPPSGSNKKIIITPSMGYQSARTTHELWLGYTNNDPVFQYWKSNDAKNTQFSIYDGNRTNF